MVKSMTTGERTKQLIIDTFTEMLREMPLEAVRIQDLCARCGIDRHTFYYHFKDKYDLVIWIHTKLLNQLGQYDGRPFSRESMINVTKEMKSRAWFYQRCFEYSGQNSLLSDILEKSAASYEVLLQNQLGRELTPRQKTEIRYHVYGSIMLMPQWIRDDADISVEELVQIILANTPDWLKEASLEID